MVPQELDSDWFRLIAFSSFQIFFLWGGGGGGGNQCSQLNISYMFDLAIKLRLCALLLAAHDGSYCMHIL